ncbi:MAG: CHC2 zinc finger domain-containing protein, partial [bacterium]
KTFNKIETKALCDQIKKNYSILDYLRSKGVKIHERGDRLFIVCPFHSDNDPSLLIDTKNGHEKFYCFGCKKSGTIIDFYSHYEGKSIGETIDELKKGINFEFDISNMLKEFDSNEKQDEFYELNVLISIHCFEYLSLLKNKLDYSIVKKEFKKVDQLYQKIDEIIENKDLEKLKIQYQDVCLGDFFVNRFKKLENMNGSQCGL